MFKPHVGEWMWRFLAISMVIMVAWMGWVLYQLNPPQLILSSAYEALAKAKANSQELQNPKQNVQGAIISSPAPVSPPAPAEPPKAAEAAPAAASAAQTASAEPPKPAPEAPAPAKPAPAEVIDAVEAWARAWSSRDVDAYLAFYAREFLTPFGEPRDEWERGRRQRIRAPKSISVTIDSPDVKFAADDKASVTFKQVYRSDLVTAGATAKTLVMIKTAGRWLIQQEFAAN